MKPLLEKGEDKNGKENEDLKRGFFFRFIKLSPENRFSKFNNFLWVCWFLAKNIFFFLILYLLLENSTQPLLAYYFAYSILSNHPAIKTFVYQIKMIFCKW